MEPVYFTVVADFRAFIEDAATDSDYDMQTVPVGATVTFTPLVSSGDVVLATQASPRPTGFISGPVVGIIDPADGRLKIRKSADAGASGGFGFAPVRLLGSSPLLELDGPLFYTVTFSEVVWANNRRGSINGFTFEAPNSDTELNLITVFRQPGQPASGITKIAPGEVRLEDGDIIFSFAEVDIPDPIPFTPVFTLDEATDMTATGKALGRAVDAAAARAVIAAENTAMKGASGGYTPLDATGKVDAVYLPSYVADVLSYANEAAFPVTGETGKIYVAQDNGDAFRWTGSAYLRISDRVTADGITDSTSVGRAVVTAATKLAGRQAINADVFVDPRDFGGVPNAADNTAALQAALAYVGNTANKGTVIIPPGVWRYSDDLVIPRGCTLRGVSRGSGPSWDEGDAVNGLYATDPDARIFVSTDSAIVDLVIDGGGVAKWAVQSLWGEYLLPNDGSPAGRFYFNNVYLHAFTEAGFVMEGAQNPIFYNCTVRSVPIGWWFLHGAANADIYGCWYGNYVAAGGRDARFLLVKNDWTDRRLTEARLVQDNENYELLYGGGGREIRVWGGVFEMGAPDYYVEIIDGSVGDQGGAVSLNGAQIGADATTLSHIYVGPDYVGSVTLTDTIFSGAQKTVIAESGRIVYRNHELIGQAGNVVSQTEISGSATLWLDDKSRSLIRGTFDANTIANGAANFQTLGTGTINLNLTKKCLEFTAPNSNSGVGALIVGWDYYAQQYGTVTITFRLKNTSGPLLLRTIGESPSFTQTTIGTFGDGEHQIVYELTGTEIGFGLTRSGSGTTVTAELDYFSVDHGVQGGAYPPVKTQFDGILKDVAGHNWLGVERTDSAVNYVQIANSATASAPKIKALGTDTNINVDLVPKGTGVARVGTDPILTESSTNTVTNKRLTQPKIDIITDVNGSGILKFNGATTPVNFLRIDNSAAGGRLPFIAVGSDSSIGFEFIPKGTGDVRVYQPSGNVTFAASGNDTNVGINLTTKAAGTVTVNSNPVGVKVAVPATATSTGVAGQWAVDSSYVYFATGTNTWVRAAVASW